MNTHAIQTPGIGDQAGIVLFSQWNEFGRLRTAVFKHHDPDSIHDLRVSSRRMRAILELFAPFISGKSVKTLHKEIRKVTRALGHLRNIDEAIIYFTAQTMNLPAMAAGLRRARKKEAGVVISVLKGFPFQQMDRKLRKALAEMSERGPGNGFDQQLSVYLSETSIQRYQALYNLLAPATILENVPERHELRIAIKRWRYLLEILGQVCGQDYGATLEILKEYQTLLGSLNDMVAFALLAEMLKVPPQEKGAIKAALERDSAACLDRFMLLAAERPIQYSFHL